MVKWGRLGVARLAAAMVTHAEVVTARLGKVMQEDIGFHPLDFLGLLLSPWAVLVGYTLVLLRFYYTVYNVV